MGLFDFLKPKPKPTVPSFPIATPDDLAQVSYMMAYSVLPSFCHREFEDFLRMWRAPIPPIGMLLCEFCCSKQKLQPAPEQVLAFKTQDGQLTASCDYYLLQFPSPPRFSVESLVSSGRLPVLAPFFAAILHDRASHQRHYYVLGQATNGGTTLRSVTPEGANCNHGPGSEPTTFAFLELLKREHDDPSQPWAKVVPPERR